MSFLVFTKLIFIGMLSKILPCLTYKGVVNTQNALYKKIKHRQPELNENEILNLLILSRIQAPPAVAPRVEEFVHYEPLLQNSQKTLEDTILKIVEYEYILSRVNDTFDQGFGMGLSEEETSANIDSFLSIAECYIKKRIKTSLGSSKPHEATLASGEEA